jgi:hypothetical protein
MSVFFDLADSVGKQDDANADPEGKNAGHPEAHEDPVIAIYEEPKNDADREAGQRGDKERSIDFVKHELERLKWFVFQE